MAQEKVRAVRAGEFPVGAMFSQFAESWRNGIEGLFHGQEDLINSINKAN